MGRIAVGTVHEESTLVTRELAIDFTGSEEARVLGTPQMIGHMERACRNAVRPFLEPGHDTVGTHVSIAHLAATPVGLRVRFRAEVVSVEGRRVGFRVEAFDEIEKIGEGAHQRAIVHVASFGARAQAKLQARS